MLDELDHGRVKTTSLDNRGNVEVTLRDVPEEELHRCTLHAPLGLQARPQDGGQADAIYGTAGDVCEVLSVSDVHAVQRLRDAIVSYKRETDPETPTSAGEVAKGETRLHSVGPNPQMISVLDREDRDPITGAVTVTQAINVGIRAEKAAARKDDEVDCGTLRLTLSKSVIAGVPTVGIDIAYVDGLGNTGPFIGLSLTGVLVPPTDVGSYEYKIKGKIVTGSDLVKVQ